MTSQWLIRLPNTPPKSSNHLPNTKGTTQQPSPTFLQNWNQTNKTYFYHFDKFIILQIVFFFFWSMDKIHTCSGTAFYIVGKTKREGKKVSYTSNHGHKTLTLPAWCQRSDTSYCPKHHPLQGNMILYNIAPMVDFWEHYWFHCRHRFQLSPAICFVSFSTHQQGDNPQKISPTMDKDERND